MTREAQRIAIAEACGWRNVRELDDLYPDGSVSAGIWWQGLSPETGSEELIPDYLNDLNAMHDAEKMLASAAQCRDYADMLDDGNGGHFATVAQRREAFLKTLGLWTP